MLFRSGGTLQEAEALFAAYSDVMERILGAPKGSIQPMTTEAIRIWFSNENTLDDQNKDFAEEADVPASSNL